MFRVEHDRLAPANHSVFDAMISTPVHGRDTAGRFRRELAA